MQIAYLCTDLVNDYQLDRFNQRLSTGMDYRRYVMMLSLLTLALSVRAQVAEDRKRLHVPDSVENDYEEWLRNEPLRPEQHDTMAIGVLPPSIPVDDPMKTELKQPPVSINIMTRKKITDCFVIKRWRLGKFNVLWLVNVKSFRKA